MGWMRTVFLGDIGNRLDIEDNESRIRRLRSAQRRRDSEKRQKDASQDAAIEDLQSRVEDLTLAVGTLSRVLVARGVATEEELGGCSTPSRIETHRKTPGHERFLLSPENREFASPSRSVPDPNPRFPAWTPDPNGANREPSLSARWTP